MSESVLSILDRHPLTGAMVLVALLIVQQILKTRKGNEDVNRVERETNKLARQTSETVNRCAERTQQLMDAMERHLEKNDLGHLSASLDEALQLLAKMGEHQGACLRTLDRVSSVLHSIDDDLQRTDSRVVHTQIQAKLHSVESLIEDVKRIVIEK